MISIVLTRPLQTHGLQNNGKYYMSHFQHLYVSLKNESCFENNELITWMKVQFGFLVTGENKQLAFDMLTSTHRYNLPKHT